MKPLVAIIMGSDSDLPIMSEAAAVLKQAGVGYDLNVFSAHRTPDLLRRYLVQAQRKGVEVFIAGAGGAAHLPGVIAAHTTLPVIGVPIDSQLKGVDSLLSIVQMPRGIPVATVAIGKAGAANAAIFALEILRLKYPEIEKAIRDLRLALRKKVLAANRRLHRVAPDRKPEIRIEPQIAQITQIGFGNRNSPNLRKSAESAVKSK